MAQKVLPPHPWKIGAGFKAGALFGASTRGLLAAAIIAAVTWWQGGYVGDLVAEQRIWNDSRSVEVGASYSGHRSTTRRSFTNTYRLDVTYDVEGRDQTTRVDFETFGRIDSDADPIVRFDPDHPERCALNVAVDKSGGRWGAAILYWLIFMALGGAILRAAWSHLQKYLYARALETKGVELHCRLTAVEDEYDDKDRPTNNSIYRVVLPGKREDARSPFPTSTTGRFVLPKGRAPLAVDGEGKDVVVLVPFDAKEAPDPLLGLRADFYPLVLDAAQTKTLRAKLAKRTKPEAVTSGTDKRPAAKTNANVL